MEKHLALFDFDGTITRKDTLIEFMRFSQGTFRASLVFIRLLPSAVKFALKLISNQEFKEVFLRLAYCGADANWLKECAEAFTKQQLPGLIREKAKKRIQWHRDRGHRIVLVSASADIWLEPWCRQEKIELICSHLEVVDGKLTGKIAGKNCRKAEKVSRIKAEIDVSEYSKIYAYGDSSGDTEMLAFADDGQFRPFH